jgi:N-methylhydantoinase B
MSDAPAVTTPLSLIDVEVHNKTLLNLTREMAITLMRTSGSPVVTEAKDFSVCLLDTDVEQLAFSGWVSFHISTAVLGVQAVLERTAVEDLRPGDAFMCNDPHTSGAIHQGDVGIVMPLFVDGVLRGYGYVNEHVLDIGGSAVSGFAPEARDCFSETLRFSGIRIARDGILDPQWEEFIATNVRLPGPVLNDIRSMIASLNVGQARLEGLIHQIGPERFVAYNAEAKRLSEEAMRARIRQIPDGTYESETWIEYDARGPQDYYRMACRLVVDDDRMTIQYRGDPQVDSYVNGAVPAMVGQTWTTMLCQIAWDIPVNAGIRRPITFDLGPAGTVVNAVAPAPVTMSHMEAGFRINRLVCDVLSQACSLSDDPQIAGRVAGEASQSASYTVTMGVDRRTQQPAMAYAASVGILCGGGAQTVCDGLDTYAAQAMTGTDIPDVEIDESTLPGMILWRRIVPDTGGPGALRGGLGIESALAITHADHMSGMAVTLFPTIPARGASGGLPGSGGSWHVLRGTRVIEMLESGEVPLRDTVGGTVRVEPAKTAQLQMSRGDVFVGLNGGGGGVGDPLTRDPAAVAADVYGVALTDDGSADEPATDARRAELRARRIGGKPSAAAVNDTTTGTLRVVDGEWRCVACEQALTASDRNWRSGAIGTEQGVGESLEALGMFVRTADVDAPPVARIHHCPSCATVLTVDLTLLGRPEVPAARPGVLDPWPTGQNPVEDDR